jgi:hypothetical protein
MRFLFFGTLVEIMCCSGYTRSAILVAATLVMTSCSSDPEADYRSATQTNTVEGYKHFLAAHPEDQRKQRVLARIDELSWGLAQKTNSIAAIDDYINHFPDGKFLKEANALKADLETAKLPVFEGRVVAVMGLGGVGLSGEMFFELHTTSGNYQLITSPKTDYKGFKDTPTSRRWDTTRTFTVRGTLTGPPRGPHLSNVKFIDAKLIEQN